MKNIQTFSFLKKCFYLDKSLLDLDNVRLKYFLLVTVKEESNEEVLKGIPIENCFSSMCREPIDFEDAPRFASSFIFVDGQSIKPFVLFIILFKACLKSIDVTSILWKRSFMHFAFERFWA